MIINLHNELLWGNARLPSAYQEVEYLGLDGQCKVDLGIITTVIGDTVDMITTLSVDTFSSQQIHGKSGGFDTGTLTLSGSGKTLKYYVRSGATTSVSATMTADTKYTYEGVLTIGTPGTSIATLKDADGNILSSDTQSQNVYVFPSSNYYVGRGYTAYNGLRGKLYYYKMLLNDTPLFELIPCYRKSDNVIGFYDLVNSQFLQNVDTGTFTKGADVN